MGKCVYNLYSLVIAILVVWVLMEVFIMYMRKIAALCMVSVLTLGLIGCTTVNPRTGERQLTKTSQGALIGGGTGALVGAVAGGTEGAVIGGAIGAAGGAAVGSQLEN